MGAVTTKAKLVRPVVDAEFLSIDEAADLLRVNRNTLYEAAKRGELPGIVKIGRILRIRRSALLTSGGADVAILRRNDGGIRTG